MSVDANLAKQLEEIIQTGLERVAIPYQKGNSIRIKNMVIRGHKNGYRLFDITNNKHVTTTFTKTAAVAIAKLTAEDADFKMKDIIKLDDKVAKHYMDALYAKNTIKMGGSAERIDTAEVRFEIATDNAWVALADIERYIFDK
jgi:hypothetical protein|tara:strand:+ start:2421 stop:2849 length:429 start_codon:yes stop_codon:yes gene_type:complete